jgi:hypothetical protein
LREAYAASVEVLEHTTLADVARNDGTSPHERALRYSI